MNDDNLTFSKHALEKMVSLAIEDVDGIAWMHRSRRGKIIDAVSGETDTRGMTVTATRYTGLTTDASRGAVDVNVDISMECDSNALDIFTDIHKQVHQIFRVMTPLTVHSVNVCVSDISMPDEDDIEESVDEFVT